MLTRMSENVINLMKTIFIVLKNAKVEVSEVIPQLYDLPKRKIEPFCMVA